MSDTKDPNENSQDLDQELDQGTPVAPVTGSNHDADDFDDEDQDQVIVEDGNIEPINIVDELKTSYLDYAMSVIMGRALPDARDGFKPVHRRVIYAMHIDGHTPSKPFVKSAEIVGKVMGLFHPHGDSAIYDTLVRMAQDFSLRYPLVQGQGNFGGRGDESPAAMRYTEARMSKIALELVKDIDKETVDFVPNYSNKTVEPLVLPTRIPNLLINGSAGIAVGMATTIPPHNLTEVINGCLAYVNNPDISIDELMQHIPAPDFPTGCTILGRSGIREAYHTGRGKLYLRAIYSVRETKRSNIVNITEIPYQVSYHRIIEKVQDLMRNGELPGVTEILNLSKSNINIELKIHRDYDPHVVMNQLFAKTPLQSSINFNMLALYNGKPELLNLKQFIQIFVDFRREVITRRCVFELNRSRQRTHTLEALSVALANIDEIIHLIRSSQRTRDAQDKLMARGWKFDVLATMLAGLEADPTTARPEFLDPKYGINKDENLYYFTEEQTKSILEMPLSRLTGLEQDTITEEYQKLVKYIIDLIAILGDPERLNQVLREELIEVRDANRVKANNYDARLSPISDSAIDVSEIDFVNKEEAVITVSRDGYIKYQSLAEYRSQRRGGRGRTTGKVKEEDVIEQLAIGQTTDTVLIFTNLGRVYSTPVYKLPRASAQSRGRAVVNYLQFQEGEKVANLLILDDNSRENPANKYIFFTTEKGLVKKTPLADFLKIRQSGIIAFPLNRANVLKTYYGFEVITDEMIQAAANEADLLGVGADRLASVSITQDNDDIYLVCASGFVNAFKSDLVSPVGRKSVGVVGMRLQNPEDKVIGAICATRDSDPICTVTASGYAKRTFLDKITIRKARGGFGMIIHDLKNAKTGKKLVAVTQLHDKDQLAIITDQGRMLRFNSDSISIVDRTALGVRAIRLADDEQISGIERIINGVEIEQEHLGLTGEADTEVMVIDKTTTVVDADGIITTIDDTVEVDVVTTDIDTDNQEDA